MTKQAISKCEDTLHFFLFLLLQILVRWHQSIHPCLNHLAKKSFKYSLRNLQHDHFRLQSNTFLFPQELHQQDAIITCLPPSAWVVRWERCLQEHTHRSLAATQWWANCNPEHITHLLPASPCSDTPRDKGVQRTPTSLIRRCSMRHYSTLLLISRSRNGRHTTNTFSFSLNKNSKKFQGSVKSFTETPARWPINPVSYPLGLNTQISMFFIQFFWTLVRRCSYLRRANKAFSNFLHRQNRPSASTPTSRWTLLPWARQSQGCELPTFPIFLFKVEAKTGL